MLPCRSTSPGPHKVARPTRRLCVGEHRRSSARAAAAVVSADLVWCIPSLNSGLPHPTGLWGRYFSLARLRKPCCLFGRPPTYRRAAPSSLLRFLSNVPRGVWPAFRAISRTRQSENPMAGRCR